MEIPKNLQKLIDAEGIEKQCYGGHIVSGMIVSGRLFLTKDRLAFRKSPNFLAGFFAAFIKQFKMRYTLNIEIHQIKSYQKGKYGLNKNILDVETKSGLNLKFAVDKIDPWLTELGRFTID